MDLFVEGLDVGALSDDELQRSLERLGFFPGPILASTRAVYKRKLVRLLRGEDFPLLPGSSPSGSEEEPEEEADMEVRPSPILSPIMMNREYQQVQTPPGVALTERYDTPATSFGYEELRRRPLPRLITQSSYETPNASYSGAWNPEDIVSQVAPPPGEMERPLVPTSYKIGIAAVLILFAVIVYFNMESASVNPLTN